MDSLQAVVAKASEILRRGIEGECRCLSQKPRLAAGFQSRELVSDLVEREAARLQALYKRKPVSVLIGINSGPARAFRRG